MMSTELLANSPDIRLFADLPKRVGFFTPADEGDRMSKDRPLLGFVVLVVDDETDSRESAAMIIRQLGCDVLEASSTGDALRVLASDARVDLLFSDIAMPERSRTA